MKLKLYLYRCLSFIPYFKRKHRRMSYQYIFNEIKTTLVHFGVSESNITSKRGPNNYSMGIFSLQFYISSNNEVYVTIQIDYNQGNLKIEYTINESDNTDMKIVENFPNIYKDILSKKSELSNLFENLKS